MTRLMTLATCLGATCALCLAAIPAARANLLTNGGFETENATPAIPPPGWTASGTGMAIDSSFPHSGTYDVAFTALSSDASPGILSQAVATTSGQSYTLSFWLLDENINPASDAFAVTFGLFTDSVPGSNLTPSTYTNVVLTIPGSDVTNTTTTLSFQGLLDPNGGTSPFNLDDVSLVPNTPAIPEPPTAALLGVALALTALCAARRRQTGRG